MGMSEVRASYPQKVLSEAVKLVVGLRSKSCVTSPITISSELQIPSIMAVVSAARTRAFLKFPHLRTVISELMVSSPVCRKRTWVTGTQMWIRRFCPEAELIPNPSQGAVTVKNQLSDRLITSNHDCMTLVRYNAYGYYKTRHYLKHATRYPALAKGITWLCRFRIGSIWTSDRLVKIKVLPNRYVNRCPCCNAFGVETYEHILLQCIKWNAERADYLQDWLDEYGLNVHYLLGEAVKAM